MTETEPPHMSTRERSGRPRETTDPDDEFSFVSEADIAAYLAEQEVEDEEQATPRAGFWNLQTASGIGMIGLGVLYSLQVSGLLPLGSDLLANLVSVLPVLASILIILTGFGVLSWSPAARRRRKARERATRLRQQARKTMGRTPPPLTERPGFEQAERVLRDAGRLAGTAARAAAGAATEAARTSRAHRRAGRRLTRDYRNRKLTGVAAGIAAYFGLDPTVVRLAWVAATIFTSGSALVPYILLSFLLPREDVTPGDDDDAQPWIRVVRD